jgi:RNA polymerase sigma factor (sigma-70 family)
MQNVSSALPVRSEFLSESVLRRIHFRAGRLRRKFGLSREDEKDLRQDFWAAIVRAGHRFDASRCAPDRYVAMVLNSRYKHHVREFMLARQRDAMDVMSIEDVGADAVELIVDPAAETALERSDLASDVQTILKTLSAEDRRICLAVMKTVSPHEAARRLGVFPSAVYRTLKRLQPTFAAMGVTNIS